MFSVCARRLQSYKDTISCLYLRLGDQEEWSEGLIMDHVLKLVFFWAFYVCMAQVVVQHVNVSQLRIYR